MTFYLEAVCLVGRVMGIWRARHAMKKHQVRQGEVKFNILVIDDAC